MSISAHYWTIAPPILHRVVGPAAPASEPWQTVIRDRERGPVRITGRLRRRGGGAGTLVVVVHGLGGHAASGYAVRAAVAAEHAGLDCLRLNLRGADRSGEDFYHAGLTDDLAAALAIPEAGAYQTILLLGYSLGGHLVLRYASGEPDFRVRAAAAVCAPLELDSCCAAMDRPALWLYRRYLLAGLNDIYRRVAARRPVPVPVEAARRIRTLRAWDEAVVAPRHGFSSAEDYYAKASVAPHLRDLKVPSLLLASTRDPMVPVETLRPWVSPAPPALHVRWLERGGHVGFPSGLDLQQKEAPPGLEPQVLRWLLNAAG